MKCQGMRVPGAPAWRNKVICRYTGSTLQIMIMMPLFSSLHLLIYQARSFTFIFKLPVNILCAAVIPKLICNAIHLTDWCGSCLNEFNASDEKVSIILLFPTPFCDVRKCRIPRETFVPAIRSCSSALDTPLLLLFLPRVIFVSTGVLTLNI